MTATRTAEVELIATSTPNFFYAISSNGHDVYALLITAPGCATCTCVGCEVYGKNCKHRKQLLATYSYVDPEISSRWSALEAGLQELNQTIQNAIEDASAREAFETMIDTAA